RLDFCARIAREMTSRTVCKMKRLTPAQNFHYPSWDSDRVYRDVVMCARVKVRGPVMFCKMSMSLLGIAFLFLILVADGEAQLNFSTGWGQGKRSQDMRIRSSNMDCSPQGASLEQLLKLYSFIQFRLEKYRIVSRSRRMIVETLRGKFGQCRLSLKRWSKESNGC
ncbi:hypothetical protein ALC56_00207, partial [Trachymyrmex septentrionalis]